jgi:hypothetical protein
VPAAIGASALMALATSLQHRSSSDVAVPTLHPASLVRFARSLLQHRLWQLAVPIQICGLVLHALALHGAALAVVQPLLLCTVVFALPLNHALHGNRISRLELVWAVVLVVGLTGFLTISAATPSEQPVPPSMAVLVGAGLAGIIAVCVLASQFAGPAPAAALFGIAAGAAYSAEGLFLQDTTNVVGGGVASVLSSGALYGVLVAGGIGFLLAQLAFRAGPLGAALPAITTTNPVVGVILGVTINHEHLRATPLALAGETFSLLLITLSGVALARTTPRSAATTTTDVAKQQQGVSDPV